VNLPPGDELAELGNSLNAMCEKLAEKRKVQLCAVSGSDPLEACVDASQIQQVLTNLIVNAIQAMPEGGEVHISLRRQIAGGPGHGDGGRHPCLAIEVRDEGVGIAEEHMPHLFEPFFTTKGTGKGTGLGLSIAYGIVQEHGGWIEVASRLKEGSCFTVFLPEGSAT